MSLARHYFDIPMWGSGMSTPRYAHIYRLGNVGKCTRNRTKIEMSRPGTGESDQVQRALTLFGNVAEIQIVGQSV